MKLYHSSNVSVEFPDTRYSRNSNMTQESITVLQGEKTAKIIEHLSNLYNISLNQAADIYYNSDTSILIEEGVADLHCRSEKYLAQCVWDEYTDDNSN